MNIKNELVEFVQEKLYPIYVTFDKGHDVNHIEAVIRRALELYEYLGDDTLDINVLYAAAALHDIGIQIQRKGHAQYSQEFVLSCEELKKMFADEEIRVIGEAVADHSTSVGREPRSLYGKIVCDADKDDDLETSLLRAYEFSIAYNPGFGVMECLEDTYQQLYKKFGDEGKVKYWINSDKQQAFKEQMHRIAVDRELFNKTMSTILERQNSVTK